MGPYLQNKDGPLNPTLIKTPGIAAIVLLLVLLSAPLLAQQNLAAPTNQAQTHSSDSAAAASSLPSQSSAPITDYRLPPDLHVKAHGRNRIHFRLNLIGIVYGIVVLWLILRWKLAPKFRNWSERFSARSFLQGAVFAPLLLLTLAILTLPLDIYGEAVEKKYGISVQSWGSWGWDWIKGQLISFVIGTILIWLLYLVIRRSPRRWWFYFWLVSLPIGAFLVFMQPLVIDPMFHKFEPLQQKDPALVASLQQMVQRAGQNIPSERMFWMGAGEKTTSLNAYVTGLGASKRIVVWDNTIADMTTPEIVYVAGHETGHYVLKHIAKGMLFFAVLLLIAFYLGYRTVGWVLARFGTGWGIRGLDDSAAHRGLDDWASLPVLLLLLSIFSFVVTPIGSAFSRHLEHQADQYGLEVTHGLTPDSNQVAARAFQVLGEVGLSDPDPNPVDVFLFYDHPTTTDRVRFAVTYDPWKNGSEGEFVKRPPRDETLWTAAVDAFGRHHCDIGRITLQTLINTYPDSKYAADADRMLHHAPATGCTEPASLWVVGGPVGDP